MYFSPTSQTVTSQIAVGSYATLVQAGGQAVVHRKGDLNGTTTVGIYVIPSDNMYGPEDYYSDYNIITGPNMEWISDLYFNLTFYPGVSEQTINIRTSPIYFDDSVSAADYGSDFHGTVKLDIVEVNDGYNIGSDHAYTLNVVAPTPSPSPGTTVQFSSPSGTFTTGTVNATKYDFYIPVTRTGDTSGPLIISLTGFGSDWNMNTFDFYSGTAFTAGSSTTNVQIYATGGTSLAPKTGTLSIGSTSDYTAGTQSTYVVTIQYPTTAPT